MKDMACKDCFFFVYNSPDDEEGYADHGDCHRYPPAFTMPHPDGDRNAWCYQVPETYDTNWCGEFKPKE